MSDERDRIAVELAGFAGGAARGTSTGGGFTFDPETIREVINNYKDLADSYAQSAKDAWSMTQVGPSADEFVSKSFAEKANRSGGSFVEYCRHYAAFYSREAQKCQDALDTYLGVEDRAVIGLGGAGDDGSRPAV
jgi:PE family protein